MSMIIGWFANPLIKYGAIALAVVIVLGGVGAWYSSKISVAKHEGETLVIDQVQNKTIADVEKARQEKEKADAAVRATPYDGNVDGLR